MHLVYGVVFASEGQIELIIVVLSALKTCDSKVSFPEPILLWTVHRPHCQQFSVERFSTKETVPIKLLTACSGDYHEWLRTWCWKKMLLFKCIFVCFKPHKQNVIHLHCIRMDIWKIWQIKPKPFTWLVSQKMCFLIIWVNQLYEVIVWRFGKKMQMHACRELNEKINTTLTSARSN